MFNEQGIVWRRAPYAAQHRRAVLREILISGCAALRCNPRFAGALRRNLRAQQTGGATHRFAYLYQPPVLK